jgi:hypothetical protein
MRLGSQAWVFNIMPPMRAKIPRGNSVGFEYCALNYRPIWILKKMLPVRGKVRWEHTIIFIYKCTGKGKFDPRTGHEGSDEDYRYNSAVSLTLALDGDRCSTPRPGRLTPRERDPVPIVQDAGWAPGPVWTGMDNVLPHRDLIPGPSSP